MGVGVRMLVAVRGLVVRVIVGMSVRVSLVGVAAAAGHGSVGDDVGGGAGGDAAHDDLHVRGGKAVLECAADLEFPLGQGQRGEAGF